MFLRLLRAFGRRRDGSVSVVSAMMLPILITMVGMVAEYGNGLLQKVEDQRVADAAAFAAATAYNANPANSLTSAVDQAAAVNGLPSSDIAAALVASPSGDGNNAIRVTVTTSQSLLLSKIMSNTRSSLSITATSYAELKGGAPGCIIALNAAGTGVTLSGGTSITAAACAVASDATVTSSCGTTITTIAVDYNTSLSECTTPNSIAPPTGKSLTLTKSAVSDPLAGNSTVSSLVARLATGSISGSATSTGVKGIVSPTITAPPTGLDVAFKNNTASLPAGCTDVWNSGTATHTVTCTGNGPFNFGAITERGGENIYISATGAAPVFNFSGLLNFSSNSMAFGPGTYNMGAGLDNSSGGGSMYFSAGTYNIAAGNFSCDSSNSFSICNVGTSMTFGVTPPSGVPTGVSSIVTAGAVTMTTGGGIFNSGGYTMTLGTGSTNSFELGKATNGDSFAQGGGATTVFGDATGSGDVFVAAGNIDVNNGGGSCLTVSAATEHDINGYFSSAGGTTMGSGIYTIYDYFALGPNNGGDVTCGGTLLGLYAYNVSMVVGGATTTTNSDSFYMGAGYSKVTLVAPTSGTSANMAVIGPQSGSAGAALTEGASDADVSGAFYFPTEAVSLNGGSSMGSIGSSQCLMVIGSQVTVAQGAALGTTCTGVGTSAGSSVVLVQ